MMGAMVIRGVVLSRHSETAKNSMKVIPKAMIIPVASVARRFAGAANERHK